MRDRKDSSRSNKVASEIKRVVSEWLIRGDVMSYEDINPLMIVVTDVEVSPCLQHAKIFISTMNDSSNCDDCLRFLGDHSAQIRRAVGCNIKLKFVPEIRFYEDKTREQAQKIEKLLSSLN